ncbi:hypothetical protein FML17_17685 [Klebsiella michiganensis]|nr:hypothetical protein [Klebsiella michiganensis]MBZ7623640.1 hypothetical protein [Klebsiella michiganensis]HDX8999220.1 hypothetical protein [Klebsiella michiganensis]
MKFVVHLVHNRPQNPFPAGEIQLRNFLICRLLLNYGLRVSELLLLECHSIKPICVLIPETPKPG